MKLRTTTELKFEMQPASILESCTELSEPLRHSRLRMTELRRIDSNSRRGYQLIEVVVALATSAILLSGVAASVYMSQKSVGIASSQLKRNNNFQHGLQRFQQDLAESKQILSKSATSISLRTADRNSDGNDDIHYYRWSASTGPLQYSSDGTTYTSITDNLSAASLTWRAANPPVESDISLDPSGLVYRGQSVNSLSTAGKSLTLVAPGGALTNDLAVAVIVYEGDAGTQVQPAGWSAVWEGDSDEGSGSSMGVWTSRSVPATSTFTWSNSRVALGAILLFSGSSSTSPVADWDKYTDDKTTRSPSVNGSYSDRLALRLHGSVGKATVVDAPRMLNHGTISLEQTIIPGTATAFSPADYVTLGIVYRTLVSNASVNQENFLYQPAPSSACSVTLVLRP